MGQISLWCWAIKFCSVWNPGRPEMGYSCHWHLNSSKFWAKTWSRKELTVNEGKGKESQSLYLLAAEKAADVFTKQLCPSWADKVLSDWKGTNANCAAWHASAGRDAAACVSQRVAAREFRSLGVQLPKALAPAVFNLCFGTIDGWVPQQHLARDRRMTACGSHPTPCRASTGMWTWCREHGAGSGPDLAQVAAKPPQLYTQLGQRDWIMNVCSKASLKVKQ